MAARVFLFVPLLFAACGTVRDWRELRTEPMTLGECFDGIEHVAQREFVSDGAVSDRGLGIWQSRWRQRMLERNFPGRFRLRVEVMLDEGTTATGWPIRYVVEQERVDDLRRSLQPREEDWSSTGQDKEKEALLGERLVRRLAPKSTAIPVTRRPGT